MSNAHAALRRASCLLAWYDDQDVVLENFVSGRQCVVHPALLPVLASLTQPQPYGELIARLGAGSTPIVEQLIDQHVLLATGTAMDVRDAAIDGHWQWGLNARYFHFSTAQTQFSTNLEQEHIELREMASRIPQPRPFKTYGGEGFPVAAEQLPQVDFFDVLRRRRTGRKFRRTSLPRAALSSLLEAVWGVSMSLHDNDVGPITLKTSPSGGARHPTEAYFAALRVEDVPPGIYHFDGLRNVAELLRSPMLEDEVVQACAGQPWVADASVVFFMTSVVERSTWKYKNSHAYRVLLLDAGHLGQTFHLVCTALGLSPWTSAAFDTAAVERLIGIDGVAEVAIYTAACGIAANTAE